jgi:putative transposon-encoded protein
MPDNRKLVAKTELKVEGILGFMIKKVTKFGTGAKVDCPKEYLGKTVYLVVCED